MKRLCDSHALIATMDRQTYPLASDAAPPAPGEMEAERDVEKLLSAMDADGVNRAILVQRNRYYGHDNRYICDAIAHAPGRLRAICAADGRMADCATQMRHWLAQPGVAGLRFMEPERGAPFDWFAGDHARAAWKVAADAGAIVQIHFFPWARQQGIAILLSLLRDTPVQTVIVDNLSNIDLAAGAPGHGIDESLRRLAEHPAIMTRVTTMALHRCAESGVDAAEALAEVAGLFGTQRILWGTDILPPRLGYGDAVRLGIGALARIDAAGQAAIAGGNAEALFFTGPLAPRSHGNLIGV